MNELKKQAFEANLDIVKHSLVTLTWGNASAFDRNAGIFAIKPSGVPYTSLSWKDMVLMDLEGGIIDSPLRPSSDTNTHLELYKVFKEVNGIVHTHSTWATVWAQAARDIPILGTTHADYFNGEIPCIPNLKKAEVEKDYEKNTGIQIANYFKIKEINPIEMPGCLLANHAPFTWGKTVEEAVRNSIVLEQCAKMAYYSLELNENAQLPDYILKKHYSRKHGAKAYYGQPEKH